MTDSGRPSRSSRTGRAATSPPQGGRDTQQRETPKSRPIGDIRKELRTRGLATAGLDQSAMLDLLGQAEELEKLCVPDLRQILRDRNESLGGTKGVLVNRVLQPETAVTKGAQEKKKKRARKRAPPNPPKTRVSKKRTSTATKRVAGEKQGQRIKALEADKESLQGQLARLEREGQLQAAIAQVKMESVKHETEARMMKVALDNERASGKLALESARNVMPESLARQLIGTHAIALGGSSTGGQFSASPNRGSVDIRQFTVEQAVEFVVELGEPFTSYRDALLASSVDGDLLAELTDQDLETVIRVSNKLHRKKILNAIKKACATIQ